ncbi:hypothetical protein GCM10022243_48930 [Saccharothrix violaceirubra]|uniref:DUF3307 domain-containing protein n=1 Tax=Saccharothrix violaceirubra TaxID=413306 RepID=A0A7W7T1S6_9PSEU|nr:DUF3307 domain-containing protein [Saccharothrix violaceirubra]MBB4963765.1 hypothetical protein [Saccharothrix violaceirubra]
MTAGTTAALVFVALYTAHHLADHWVQTDHQAIHKGLPGWRGRLACARHVATYTLTTLAAVLAVLWLPLGLHATWTGIAVGQAVSAVTHYVIDRRTPLARLAHATGKGDYHDRGTPRPHRVFAYRPDVEDDPTADLPLDQAPVVRGAYFLDQSLHIAVLFAAALITALL